MTASKGALGGNTVTVTAPANIALVKYWGKRDETLVLPVNSSISITLDPDLMCSKTTVTVSTELQKHEVWLNGRPQDIGSNKRLQRLLDQCMCSSKSHAKIISENNFPTAAGLASSASGYAALVSGLLGALQRNTSTREASILMRQGSGSACRSVAGGFVVWHRGCEPSGSDSYAEMLFDEHHWPELCVIILVVKSCQKDTGSTAGMQQTVRTSEIVTLRPAIAEKRVEAIIAAVREKDFSTLAEITMKESNQLHAMCLDTYPPITYLTATSYQVIRMVHRLNDTSGHVRFGYTFDAGPNAVLLCERQNLEILLKSISNQFGISRSRWLSEGFAKIHPRYGLLHDLVGNMELDPSPSNIDVSCEIEQIILTRVGSGPRSVSET
eukprot:Rmarinus@m.20945